MEQSRADQPPSQTDPQDFPLPARSKRVSLAIAAATLVLIAAVITILALTERSSEDKAGTTPPSQADSLLSQGVNHYRSGEFDSASRHFMAALAIQPNNVRAHYDLGVVDGAQGKANLANRHYSEALKINPQFAPALFNRAILEAQQSDDAGAIRDYRAVIRVQPENASALWNLGLVLYGNGRKSDGQGLMKEAVVIKPDLRSRLPAGVSLG